MEKDPTRLIDTLNIELKKLTKWFKVNTLSLNVGKSIFMVFGNPKVEFKSVVLDGCDLIRVTVTKFLGVLRDDKFTWINQINAVKRKISSAIGSTYRIKNKVDECTLLTIYNTLILPHIMYSCEIWGNTYQCRLSDLMLQKRAVRVINKASYRDHATAIFKKI